MGEVPKSHLRFVLVLLAVYAVTWGALAIAPLSRQDWALENIVVAVALLVVIGTWRWFKFSKTSYVLIFLFLCLHAVASQYTYSHVPYDAVFERLTGRTLNSILGWERNNYDRVVHFLYGLLLMLPFREAFLHIARVRWPFWSYLLPFSFVLSTSMVYELLEWAAAEVLGGDEGLEFLGVQGDIWDAQRDSFLATLGAFITLIILVIFHLARRRDASREWAESQDERGKA